MFTALNKADLETVLKLHHTGLVILMPGGTDCPGNAAIAQQQKVVMGLNGCPRCMLYAMRALSQENPDFKRMLLDSLNKNFNP